MEKSIHVLIIQLTLNDTSMKDNSTEIISLSVLDYPIYVQVIVYAVLLGLLFLVGALVYAYLRRRKKEETIQDDDYESDDSDQFITVNLPNESDNYMNAPRIENESPTKKESPQYETSGTDSTENNILSSNSLIAAPTQPQNIFKVESESNNEETKSITSNQKSYIPMIPIIEFDESNSLIESINEKSFTNERSPIKNNSTVSSSIKELPIQNSDSNSIPSPKGSKSQSSSYSLRIRNFLSKSSITSQSNKSNRSSSYMASEKENKSNSADEMVIIQLPESKETIPSTLEENESPVIPVIPVIVEPEPLDRDDTWIPLTISASTGLLKMSSERNDPPEFIKDNRDDKTKKIHASNNDVIILQDKAQETDSYIVESLRKTNDPKENNKPESSDDEDSEFIDNRFSKKLVSSLERFQKNKKETNPKNEKDFPKEDHSPRKIIDSPRSLKKGKESVGINSGVSHSSPILSKIDDTDINQAEGRRINSLTKVTDDDEHQLQDMHILAEQDLQREAETEESTETDQSIRETIPVIIKYFASWNKTGKVLNITILSAAGMNDLINYVGWKSLKLKLKEYPRKLYHYSTRWKPIQRPFFNNNFTFYHMEEEKLAESLVGINLYAKKSFGRGFLVASTMIELSEIDLTSVLCGDVKKVSMNVDVSEYKRF